MMATASIRDRKHCAIQIDGDAADLVDALAFVSGRPKGHLLSDLVRDVAGRDPSVIAVLEARRTPPASISPTFTSST